MPRRGRHRKKTRTHVVATDERITSALHSSDALKVPRSLVVRRGRTEGELAELVSDLRGLMRPHTALSFREDARNRKMTLKRYADSLSGPMGITHVLAVSQNSGRVSLRVGRAPGGPTLTFRVKRFTLGRHIRSVQRRPYDSARAFDSPPVVVTNNFGDASSPPHVKLMRITFQNMFPAINVGTVKLGECRRVVLFNFVRRDNVAKDGGVGEDDGKKKKGSDGDGGCDNDLEDEEVEVRHYAIRTKPVGVDRRVRRLVEAKVPNLGRLNDIAEYIARSGEEAGGAGGGTMGAGDVSDSEAEDEANQVVMPPSGLGRRRKKKNGDGGSSTGTGWGMSSRSALKLVELGPRLRLKLHKVERLLGGGDVMYHAYVSKTPAEVAALKKRKGEEASLRKRRREEQEGNVERKRRAKEEKREARERRRREREERAMAALRGEGGEEVGEDDGDDDDGSEEGNGDDDDDDGGEEEGGGDDGGSESGDGDDDDDDDESEEDEDEDDEGGEDDDDDKDDVLGSEEEEESEGSSRE